MKRTGIPDVALLDRDTDKVVGLVEGTLIIDNNTCRTIILTCLVLYTSKMSNTKISMLNKSEIPWVETKAEDVMGWTGADPLIAYRSSEPVSNKGVLSSIIFLNMTGTVFITTCNERS